MLIDICTIAILGISLAILGYVRDIANTLEDLYEQRRDNRCQLHDFLDASDIEFDAIKSR